ncbi:response regulator [Fulvivirgaceae bacterium BMA10]|uniref:Response regulator n=1 Tax=Splendidivirga corallicola TaxID=3051826 RepID=A0ABT8KZU5_9BACT|nr:response regulator [Fulvivirgaceae bacterium BMA10]
MSIENIRILIVEDDQLFAEQLKLELEEMGYLVIAVANNAKAALHFAKITKPEIILMDIHLSGSKDGITVAQEIYALDPVPIIFVTSLMDQETFERAKQAHPYAYLLKPANKVSLQHSIELAIQNFNEEQENKKYSLEQFPFFRQNLLIRQGNKLVKLNFDGIELIEVEEKYCTIFTVDQKFVVRISLKELLEKLPIDKFVRVHRNYVVHGDKIIAIDLEKNHVQTKSKSLPLGRKYRSALLNSRGYIS